MPEEFAFQQPRGDGSAVQLDEGIGLALAKIVDGPGDQFLACSGIAVDQDRRAGWSHGFDLA